MTSCANTPLSLVSDRGDDDDRDDELCSRRALLILRHIQLLAYLVLASISSTTKGRRKGSACHGIIC